jgi:hypothetical protein
VFVGVGGWETEVGSATKWLVHWSLSVWLSDGPLMTTSGRPGVSILVTVRQVPPEPKQMELKL